MSVTINNVRVDFHLSPPVVTYLQGADMRIPALQDTFRQIEESDEGRMQPTKQIISASGNENFTADGSVKNALTITVLPPYVQQFEAGPIPFQTIEGNLLGTFIDSPGAVVQINNSVGALNLNNPAIEYASFQNAGWVDVNVTTTGTAFPAGTRESPVNNIPDAVQIAQERGFDTIRLLSNITLDLGDNVAGMTLIGINPTRTLITINPDAQVAGVEIFEAAVTGTMDGGMTLRECLVYTLTYINGFMHNCILAGGNTITLANASTAYLFRCYAGGDVTVPPIIDMGSAGQPLVMRGYSGDIKLVNKTGPETAEIDLESGSVSIDSTVTQGPVIVRGTGEIFNNSNLKIDTDGLVQAKDLLTTKRFLAFK